jgi:hypothetical protein
MLDSKQWPFNYKVSIGSAVKLTVFLWLQMTSLWFEVLKL